MDSSTSQQVLGGRSWTRSCAPSCAGGRRHGTPAPTSTPSWPAAASASADIGEWSSPRLWSLSAGFWLWGWLSVAPCGTPVRHWSQADAGQPELAACLAPGQVPVYSSSMGNVIPNDTGTGFISEAVTNRGLGKRRVGWCSRGYSHPIHGASQAGKVWIFSDGRVITSTDGTSLRPLIEQRLSAEGVERVQIHGRQPVDRCTTGTPPGAKRAPTAADDLVPGPKPPGSPTTPRCPTRLVRSVLAPGQCLDPRGAPGLPTGLVGDVLRRGGSSPSTVVNCSTAPGPRCGGPSWPRTPPRFRSEWDVGQATQESVQLPARSSAPVNGK